MIVISLFCTFRPSSGAIITEQLKLRELHLVITETKNKNRPMSFKGGESSSQFQWFTIAKIEL